VTLLLAHSPLAPIAMRLRGGSVSGSPCVASSRVADCLMDASPPVVLCTVCLVRAMVSGAECEGGLRGSAGEEVQCGAPSAVCCLLDGMPC
jgi:hypothetical protein